MTHAQTGVKLNACQMALQKAMENNDNVREAVRRGIEMQRKSGISYKAITEARDAAVARSGGVRKAVMRGIAMRREEDARKVERVQRMLDGVARNVT